MYLLLVNTTLSIRINDITGMPFTTTTGTPQGDSLSPVLFVCYLEATLRDVRAHLQPAPQTDMIIPTETEYADDVTFISTCHEHLQQSLPQIKTILESWDLHVNESKTEWVELTSSNSTEELWRNAKVLGSLLGDLQDIQRRKQQATIAFRKMMTLWFRRQHVSESRRIRLYKAYVLPTLTYNMGTWGLTKGEFTSLDIFHRKQLRFLLGIFYPDHISNKALYKRTHSEPISTMALYARWKLFGHILRLPPNVPANKAMIAYFSQHGTGRRGRPRTTLPIVLNDDLKGTPYKLKSKKDLELLRTKAQARGEWNNLIELVAKT